MWQHRTQEIKLFPLHKNQPMEGFPQNLRHLWFWELIKEFNPINLKFNLSGSPQKIVQWGQITAPRRPIDIRILADYSIFENGAQKIDCYVWMCAKWPVLLKPNVVHVILFNFWKQKFIFEEKWPNDTTVPKSAPKSHLLWVQRLLNDDVSIFWALNVTILLIDLIDLLPKQSKMYWQIELIE